MMQTIGILLFALGALLQGGSTGGTFERRHGGIVRMDTTVKTVHLVFTGHEFADGADTILAVLGRHRALASFFFTGDFYRTPLFAPGLRALRDAGH